MGFLKNLSKKCLVIEMIFYVYMSPEVIQDANNGGPFAMDSLIGILRGFIQNCCVLEFEDNRLQKAVFNNVNQLPPSDARKGIMTLLGVLKKQNRFICNLVPNYNVESINILDVDDQVESTLLDFLLAGKNEMSTFSAKVETASLGNYNQSRFESQRSNLASNGRVFQDGELEQLEFLEEVLKKAFIHSKRIEICDGIFGEQFGDEFEYTFSKLFKWLSKELIELDCFEKIIIYCRKPSVNRVHYMKTQLSDLKSAERSNIKIEIRFYQLNGSQHAPKPLPHDRFIITDQIALTIGRGMDFLNKKTKKNRNTTIHCCMKDDFTKSINTFSNCTIESLII